MIWDRLAVFYDFFESLANSKVNRGLAENIETYIEKDDVVLECAWRNGNVKRSDCKEM